MLFRSGIGVALASAVYFSQVAGNTLINWRFAYIFGGGALFLGIFFNVSLCLNDIGFNIDFECLK